MNRKVLSVMLLFSMVVGSLSNMPLEVLANEIETIYASAYMDAQTIAETTLPESIEIDGMNTPVNWDVFEDTFSIPYDTVKVKGKAGDIPVVASVQIITPKDNPLVYFVDCGRAGDPSNLNSYPASSSPLYEAVKELSVANLKNQEADQIYSSESNTWGVDYSNTGIKNSQNGVGIVSANEPSIWKVGSRAINKQIHYKLGVLDPGTYTLTSGFYDWYGSRNRGIQPIIEYQDTNGERQSIKLNAFDTKTVKDNSQAFTIPVNIDRNVPMTLQYNHVSGENPILSWFAIATGDIAQEIEEERRQTDNMVSIVVDGNNIKADNVNGLTFKGFGVLSANSTSALLMDYKAEQPEVYTEMLKILFGGEKPVMNQVKIEMGNDRNNSTGPDPATMRWEEEEVNVKRHPGFQLAADAKKVNPNLKVSILRWNAPSWANTNDKIYIWYKNTILEAYREYGYMVDYVNPGVNEHSADLNWIKEYANRVKTDDEDFKSTIEQDLYNSIEIIISDEVSIGTFGPSMVNDASLREAVSVAGYHYNTDDDKDGSFKKLADQFDIEVWNSEAQATFSNSAFRPNNNTQDPTVEGTGIGGVGSALEMGNTIIKGFVNSRRTHFIYQPAIAAFYEGGQYSSKELVSARDPWSGWIHYDAGLDILRHFSWFANTGWENEDNTAGIWRAIPESSITGADGVNPVNGRNGLPCYITLAAPDKSDFSTIIVNDSEYEKSYKVEANNMAYTDIPALEIWETRAADEGEAFNSNYMQYLGQINANGVGTYIIKVKPYSIVTVTTLENYNKEEYNTPLPVEGERTILDTDETGAVQDATDYFLYGDDFDYSNKQVPVIGANGDIVGYEDYISSRGGAQGVMPRYTHDLNGAFEVYKDETGNYVLRQQLDKDVIGVGGAWNGGDPTTAIGDYRWTNYKASVDIAFESNQYGAKYAGIGARYQGSNHQLKDMPYVLKYWLDGGWQLLVSGSVVADGNVLTGNGSELFDNFDASYNAWHNLAIEVAGNKVTAYLDNVKLATYTDSNPKLAGRVALGSDFAYVRFDNLKVEKIEGYEPYYTEYLDDLEMNDLSEIPNEKLKYSGLWDHANGKGMYQYHRSLSKSEATGATLEYTFEGTGIDILGGNDGSAKLEVTVDGEIITTSATTKSSSDLYQTYTLRGLEYGKHTIQIKVIEGTLTIDSVGIISGQVKGSPDTTKMESYIKEAQSIEKSDEFEEDSWQVFKTNLSMAEKAVKDPANYRLDQEGANQLGERLYMAQNQLYSGNIQSIQSTHYAAAYVNGVPGLPDMVEAICKDGTTTYVPIRWHVEDVSFDTAYKTVEVKGNFGVLETICYVEVIPENMMYFADLNAIESKIGYDSPAYNAVATFLDEKDRVLKNNIPDQVYNSEEGWGHIGTVVNYKGKVNGVYSKLMTTGMYGENRENSYIGYTFDNLPSGEYKVTIGTHSWWPDYSRIEKIYLEYDGMSKQVDTFTLDKNLPGTVKEYSFTMSDRGSFTLKLQAGNNQAPMLSFIGLAAVKDADKSRLQELYEAHKDKQNENYTEVSWKVFQDALTTANELLAKVDTTQVEVDTAVDDLKKAVENLIQNQVPQGIIITKPLTDQQVREGENATFIVEASGEGILTFEWYQEDQLVLVESSDVLEAGRTTTSAYTLEVVGLKEDGMSITVKVKDQNDEKASTAHLKVLKLGAVKIETGLVDQQVKEGEDATFTVEASGEGELKFTWYKENQAIKTEERIAVETNTTTSSTLVIEYVQSSDSGKIKVKVENLSSEAESEAELKVVSKEEPENQYIAFTHKLEDKMVTEGENANFRVDINGNGEVTFEWYQNGQLLLEEQKICNRTTSSSLVIEKVRKSDEGTISIRVIGEDNTIQSTAILKVTTSSSDSDGDDTPSQPSGTVEYKKTIKEIWNNLSTTEKKKIKQQLEAYMPYVIGSNGLAVNEWLRLTNHHFAIEQLKELVENPKALLGLGINSSIQVFKPENEKDIIFEDIQEKHWAYEAIMALAQRGIIKGYEDASFRPKESLHVADTFTFLNRTLVNSDDIKMILPRSTVEEYITDKEHWAFYDICAIGSRLSEKTLAKVSQLGNEPLSRENLARVLYEVTEGKLKLAYEKVVFVDHKDITDQEAINYCVQTGLLKGTTSNQIESQKPLSRAELMTVLIRLEKLLKE